MPPKGKKKGGGGGGGGGGTPRAEAEATPRGAEPVEDPAGDEEEAEEENATGSKRDGADISRVTDFVEQKELDSKKASEAIARMTAEMKVDREAEAQRERELAAVKIEQADVDLIVAEMELDKDIAERKLREHKGDVVATLTTLVES